MSARLRVVGIDLGTTNSVLAIVEGGEPAVIPNSEGSHLTPSVVAFSKDGQRIVGEPAKRQSVLNPDRTIRSIKRKMGTDFRIEIDGKGYTPQEISAMVLQKMKADAEAYLSEKVEKAVITVPAYFNNSQRQATKDAGRIAGLDVVRIINEPTAAAMAYGLDKTGDQRIAVFDFGGGTFDISILEIGEGVFEVKATSGDTHLGGDDMDQAVIDWLADSYKKEQGIDLRNDRIALQRLRDAAEKAKIELSTVTDTNLSLPFITADANGPKHLEMKLTRAQFEKLISPLLDRLVGPCEAAIRDSKYPVEKIDKVLLVGGATRVPSVQAKVRDLFNKEPTKGVNPDEAVAVGAAIQAAVLAGEMKEVVLLDVTPLTLGVETLGGIIAKIIPRNTTIPTKKSEMFSTASDNQTAVEIHIVQGEREMARDSISLGRFHLMGIPPAPRGLPQIEVAFEIDANGILNVTAKDMGTGRAQSITVTGSTNLKEDDIRKMVREADLHAEEDKKARQEAEARNTLDSLIYNSEKLLHENAAKVPEADQNALKEALTKGKEALQKGNTSEIQSAAEEITRVMHRVSQAIYQAAGAGARTDGPGGPSEPPPPESGAPGPEGPGGVIDADYEEQK